MKLYDIRIGDVTNYKKPSMVLVCPYCDFKCEKENGIECCHNKPLLKQPLLNVHSDRIIKIYKDNKICKALIFSGLEPFKSYDDMLIVIEKFRQVSKNPIIIYTGYTEQELEKEINFLTNKYKNIIVKFGRYKPGEEPHKDPILGVNLASSNQYARKIC